MRVAAALAVVAFDCGEAYNLSSLFSSVLALFALLWLPLVIANKENRAARKCNVTDVQEVFGRDGFVLDSTTRRQQHNERPGCV